MISHFIMKMLMHASGPSHGGMTLVSNRCIGTSTWSRGVDAFTMYSPLHFPLVPTFFIPILSGRSRKCLSFVPTPTWAQAACLLVVWLLPCTCQRTHAPQRGLQAPKRKELRPYLSPSVGLCSHCTWVKLVLSPLCFVSHYVFQE